MLKPMNEELEPEPAGVGFDVGKGGKFALITVKMIGHRANMGYKVAGDFSK